MAKMYCLPADRTWWAAVGTQAERGLGLSRAKFEKAMGSTLWWRLNE